MADNLNSVSLCPLGSKVLDAFLLPQECPFSRVLILFATNVNCHYLHFPLRIAFFSPEAMHLWSATPQYVQVQEVVVLVQVQQACCKCKCKWW